MWSLEIVILVVAVFLLAGFVKGAVGLGLPTVSLALLAASVGIREAIALMLIPAIVTNIFQGLNGPYFGAILRRLWLFLCCVCIGTWYGAGILATADADRLMGLLGVVLVIYAGLSLTMLRVPPPGRWELWLSPLTGAVSGLMTGMTGSFVVPGSLYLQALGMPREMLIQTLGISFATVTFALVAGMGGHGLITLELGVLSAVAVIPAGLGMALGTRLRRRIPEALFRRTFFWALLLMGLYVTWRAFV